MIEWLVRIRVAYLIESRGRAGRGHRIVTMRDSKGKYPDRLRHPDVRDWLIVQPETAIVSPGWCGTSCQCAVYESVPKCNERGAKQRRLMVVHRSQIQ
jgi:hypothetical protein